MVARFYRPPAPFPLKDQPCTLALLFGLWRNPLSICGLQHFEEPIVSSKTPIGHISVINAPEAIHHVLVAHPDNYPKDARQLRILQPGLKTGLLTSDGEHWSIARRTLAPLFSPRAVETQANAMLACSQRLVKRLSQHENGTLINASAELARVTFDILSTVLFSDGTQTDSMTFSAALTRYFHSAGRIDPLDAIGAPHWIPRLRLWFAQPAIRFFEGLVTDIIAGRRAAIQAGLAPPRDLLTLLLEARDPVTGKGLSESDVAGSIITFIGAGHETTANTLAWSLFLLAKHPTILRDVEAEVDACNNGDLAKWPEQLPLTRAVINEAMRLYPPAPIMSRTALQSDKILGVTIPKQSTVIVAPYIVHRHRRLWDKPDYFRPERFLPGAKETIQPYSFLPFGVGPRVCIGQGFSQTETIIVLATLLSSLRFSAPRNQTVFPVHHVTLRPTPDLKMNVARRS